VQLIERVLAADVSYTISRMRVLERIPGNPIGIGYRWIDDKAVALVSMFLPAFRRVVGLRPGHVGEIEPLLAWYREYGVKPTFEIVPGMYDAALGRELVRHGFLPSGFHAALIGEPDGSTAPNADIDIEQVTSEEAMERYLDAYMAGWGLAEKDHAQFKANVRPWRVQPGWSLYLARVDDRPAAAATPLPRGSRRLSRGCHNGARVPRPRAPCCAAAPPDSRRQYRRHRLRLQRRRTDGDEPSQHGARRSSPAFPTHEMDGGLSGARRGDRMMPAPRLTRRRNFPLSSPPP
jgi:hypothetical protein